MDKFLIAPIKGGLKTDLVPFVMPEDAFSSLQNMFIYNGKIRRRPAALSLDQTNARASNSRLRVNIGATDGAGAFAGNVPGAGLIDQQFSVGNDFFTVYQANGAMLSTNAGANGTFNTGTGAVTIAGSGALTTVYWYPAGPVLGFAVFTENDGNRIEFAFDFEFAYKYETTGWERVTGGAGIWASPTAYRIQSVEFEGAVSGDSALLVTNNNDNIRYYTDVAPTFTNFIPNTSATPNFNIQRCRLFANFQQRLLLLNVVEHEGAALDIEHKNRIRYSEFGNAFAADSWYDPPGTTNKGGFVDLPAGEIITSAEILDGRLIVFCESSIYELVPTGNYREPFQISLVDNTHGNRAQNVVEVNNTLLFANNFGIYIYDGRNVIKISDDLDDTFDNYEYRFSTIHKDSIMELIYILVSDNLTDNFNFYPNSVIVYNYKNNTFSTIRDQYSSIGLIYHSATGGIFVSPYTIVGNQVGYTQALLEDSYKNNVSKTVTLISRFDALRIDIRIRRHRLKVLDAIRIENSALPGLNDSYFVLEVLSDDSVRILNDTSNVANYVGDAQVARIDEISITSKQYNFYMKQGFGTSINRIAFNVNKTAINGTYDLTGQPNGSAVEAVVPAFYIGERKLETAAYALVPEEAAQSRVWHSVYFQTAGESVSFQLTNSSEILDAADPYQELTINGIILYTEPEKNI